MDDVTEEEPDAEVRQHQSGRPLPVSLGTGLLHSFQCLPVGSRPMGFGGTPLRHPAGAATRPRSCAESRVTTKVYTEALVVFLILWSNWGCRTCLINFHSLAARCAPDGTDCL